MRTRAALCAGLALVGCTSTPPAERSAATPAPMASTPAFAPAKPAPTTSSPRPAATRTAQPTRPPYAGWHLLWVFNGVPPGLSSRVAAVRGVAEVTSVRASHIWVRSGRNGYPEVAVDAIAVEPRGFARATGSPALASALAAGAVLSRTGATLRRARVGSVIRVSGGPVLRVTAVVDDTLIGGYELAADRTRLGAGVPTYLLVRGPDTVSVGVRRAVGSVPHRWRAPGDRPFLRAADAVLPLAEVKRQFGEFAVRRSGGALVPDPRWVSRNIETRRVPLLGQVRCHRRVLDELTSALAELQRRGLARLLRPAEYAGCYLPRPLRGKDEMSRHSWGIAFDVNVRTNPLGGRPHMPRAVVDVMVRHGFTWGGTWLRPDGGHFEWVG